jgi:hypothetical protein
MIHRLTALASCFLLASCANLYPPSTKKQIDNGSSYWVSYDASRRGALILPKSSQVRACSEPAPDVGLTFVNTLKGNLTTPDGTSATGIDAAANATVVALAGRNEVVLLAREALFRICEASMNDTIGSGDVRPLIEKVFTDVAEIAKAQAQDSESRAAEAKAKALSQGVDAKLLQ